MAAAYLPGSSEWKCPEVSRPFDWVGFRLARELDGASHTWHSYSSTRFGITS
jgi:hypothetical protein